jgi:hypothetical protein
MQGASAISGRQAILLKHQVDCQAPKEFHASLRQQPLPATHGDREEPEDPQELINDLEDRLRRRLIVKPNLHRRSGGSAVEDLGQPGGVVHLQFWRLEKEDVKPLPCPGNDVKDTVAEQKIDQYDRDDLVSPLGILPPDPACRRIANARDDVNVAVVVAAALPKAA